MEPFDEQAGKECWDRLRWWLSELKEVADLNGFTAHISLSEFLLQELIATFERDDLVFLKFRPQELIEKLKEGREFFTTYSVVLSLAIILPNLRAKEFQHLQHKHEDLGDSHDYYLFTEGCIDLFLIQNAPKLVPLVENYLSSYLNLFKNPQTRWDVNIFTLEKQRKLTMEILNQRRGEFGNHFWLQRNDLQTINNEHREEFRFIETLLVMQSLGELTLYCDCPNVIRGDSLCLSVEVLTLNTDVSTEPITSCRIEYAGSGQMEVRLGEQSEFTELVGTEMELCRAVHECDGKAIAWDEAYERIENAEPPSNKDQIRKYRKKLTDAKERINKKVSAIVQKDVVVVTQDKEGNFVSALTAAVTR